MTERRRVGSTIEWWLRFDPLARAKVDAITPALVGEDASDDH
jgi:hypothetical protein